MSQVSVTLILGCFTVTLADSTRFAGSHFHRIHVAEVPAIARVTIRLAAIPPTSADSPLAERGLRAQHALRTARAAKITKIGRARTKNAAKMTKIGRERARLPRGGKN